MNRMKKKEGFTLIELMVTMVSASVLMLLVATILFLGYLSWRANGAHVQLQEDTALAMRMMSEGIHESATNEIIAVTGSLTLDPNGVRADELAFVQTGDTLVRYVAGNETGLIIRKGVQLFDPQLIDSGVLLVLELEDDDPNSDITTTNRVFVNTRNRL